MNANDFFDRARAFIAVNPRLVYVIYTTPQQSNLERENAARAAWFAYFEERSMKETLRLCRSILGGGGKAITLPCEKPEMFDLNYSPRSQAQYDRRRDAA